VGCNFHFVNAVFRQIQRLGLVVAYRDDEYIRSNARKLMALAFVPIDKLEAAFRLISREAPRSLQPLIEYFDRYWMTKVKWSLWNVSNVELTTNNFVEGWFFNFFLSLMHHLGWNHRFNRLVSKYHPNVGHLFDCLKREEVVVHQQILKMMAGAKKIGNKKVIIRQQAIGSLQSQFSQKKIKLSELLEGLSLLIGTGK
jgi:hypothetical protein